MDAGQRELYDRLVDVLGTRDVHPDDRHELQQAFGQAKTWGELPAEVRAKIVDLEGLPRQSWDDPSDIPNEQD